MTRVLGAAAAALVACAAFLGGQAVAGGNDKSSHAKPVRVAEAAKGSAPEVLQTAQDAVVLPVIAVRQLPALAAPHRAKVVKKAPVAPVTPTIQSPVQRNVNPNPPVQQPQPQQNTTPKTNSGSGGGGGGGGSGGYFDDSG